MPLNDAFCRSVKAEPKPRKHSDGGGLYLLVQPNGSKLWRINYRFGGRQKTLALGAYPAIALADARGLRAKAKEAIADGRDPGADGKRALESPVGDTFGAIVREWLDAQEVAWSPAHTLRIASRFREDVLPYLGNKAVDQITAPDILAILRKIEGRGAVDVAKRMRQSIGAVLRYAVATGRAERDPTADLRGALKPGPRVKHLAALRTGELPEFFRKLAAYDGERQTALAIELVMRTMVRTSEVRFARWSEFEDDMWRIPAERMKRRVEHLVPLAPQAQEILRQLKEIAGKSDWLLPGVKPGKPISENTMIFACYRMGYRGRITIHGMRSLASTLLNESGLWSPDAIERQLAHTPADAVRAAYLRSQFLEERRRMMIWLNDFYDQRQPDSDLRALLG